MLVDTLHSTLRIVNQAKSTNDSWMAFEFNIERYCPFTLYEETVSRLPKMLQRDCQGCRLDILGLSEVRCWDFGKHFPPFCSTVLLCSGKLAESSCESRVGLMLTASTHGSAYPRNRYKAKFELRALWSKHLNSVVLRNSDSLRYNRKRDFL